MKYIVCNLNLFTLSHIIYLLDEENKTYKEVACSDLNHLPQMLVGACVLEEVDNIHLFGTQDFVEKLSHDITAINNSYYANYKINVEVN